MNHKFNYRWKLKDTAFTKDKGKVFSCFACGGGSTMGYKLAGIRGVSLRTMIRKARQLGLTKDKTRLLNVWNERRQWAHSASKIKGYPGSFKPGNEIGKEYRFKKKIL